MTDRAHLLNQSVREIMKALSGTGKFRINRKIEFKVRSLVQDHGFDRDEILSSVADDFLSRDLCRKCNPEKALSTFAVHFVNYSLNGQIRKQSTEQKRFQLVSLDAVAAEGHDNEWGSSASFLEPQDSERLVNEITPEDLLAGKQLLDLIFQHFGEEDAQVLLGYRSRHDQAVGLAITDDAYYKRLQRKAASFKQVLIEAGYL